MTLLFAEGKGYLPHLYICLGRVYPGIEMERKTPKVIAVVTGDFLSQFSVSYVLINMCSFYNPQSIHPEAFRDLLHIELCLRNPAPVSDTSAGGQWRVGS